MTVRLAGICQAKLITMVFKSFLSFCVKNAVTRDEFSGTFCVHEARQREGERKKKIYRVWRVGIVLVGKMHVELGRVKWNCTGREANEQHRIGEKNARGSDTYTYLYFRLILRSPVTIFPKGNGYFTSVEREGGYVEHPRFSPDESIIDKSPGRAGRPRKHWMRTLGWVRRMCAGGRSGASANRPCDSDFLQRSIEIANNTQCCCF